MNLITRTTMWIAGAALVGVTATSTAADRPDAWVTAKAKLALLTADNVDGMDIDVDTTNGRVTLNGEVESDAEKTRAESVVRGIEGVQSVRNLLRVEHDATGRHHDATGHHHDATGHMKSDIAEPMADDELEEELEDALEEDWGLDDADIEVESVKGGVVVLEGETDSLAVKHRAVSLVRNYPGVVRVVDQIEEPEDYYDDNTWTRGDMDVDGDREVIDDAWITTKIKLELMARDDVPALDINVDTYDRAVTLFGIVPDEAAKRAAEMVAREIDGVASVSNDIQIVPDAIREPVEEQDEALEERVEEALESVEMLDDADIEIEVKNGVVRLSGTVERETHRLQAVTLARSVAGVKAVSNDLRVERKGTT